MKILKRVLIILAAVIAVFLIIGLFLPSKMHVEKFVIIKTSANVPFGQVNNLKNWNNWSPLDKIDPKMVKTYSGPVSGKGAKYSWTSDSREVGNGNMTIVESIPDSMVQIDLVFMGRGNSKATFYFTKMGDSSKVTWAMDADMGWNPVMHYMGMMMEKGLGSYFATGLKDLKDKSEKMKPETGQIKVEETTTKDMHALTMKVECKASEIGSKYMETYTLIQKSMKEQGLKEAGHPFGVYQSYSTEKVEMEPGIPTDKAGKSKGNINAVELKGGNALKVTHIGPYSGLMPVYTAIPAYAKEHNKQISGSPWEVYVTDPGNEKDSTKWITEVYFPVK